MQTQTQLQIGQEVYYSRSLFTRGKIIAIDGTHIDVQTNNSVVPNQTWHADTIIKTKADALNECESEIEYWTRCADKLRAELEQEELEQAK